MGQLFGEPFVVRGGYALTDPSAPNQLFVVLSAAESTCDDARALAHAPPQDFETATLPVTTMVVTVSHGALDPRSELEAAYQKLGAQMAVAFGPTGVGVLAGTARIELLPQQVGEAGRLSLSYQPMPAPPGRTNGTQPTDALAGEVAFTLCDPLVTERPSLAGTRFTAASVHLFHAEVAGLAPAEALDLTAEVPEGWTAQPDDGLGARWRAPDGLVAFELGFERAQDELATYLPYRAPDAKELAPGTWVEHTRILDHAMVRVYRQDPGWPALVLCEISGPDDAIDPVWEAAVQACTRLTLPR